jgi:molybdopterin-guanine dinucleotide biosynthesis protein A
LGGGLPASGRGSRVAGFVLAGGKSSRMGADKAMLEFRGRPMIAIALETLRNVCAEVAISGNRDDLAAWAPVVREFRLEAGPAAGIEAALGTTICEWVLMLPVDLPLVSAELLRRWMERVLTQDGVRASYMECGGNWHPALCLVHQECLEIFRDALERGDRKLTRIFSSLGDRLLVLDAAKLLPNAELCFVNVNTPEELRAAEGMQY